MPALILAQIPTALMVLYLDVLTVAAALWRRRTVPTAPRYRFALLVPAHDEERTLPRLLRSLMAVDYPRALYDVHVVADNCADRTERAAADNGALVYERTDRHLQGKGYALRWLLALVGTDYDAYVIVDADSVVSPNFLHVMNAHLARGDQVIQSYYGVLTREESWPETLRYVGLALYNGLRPRGRAALGLSAGLHGNGMCFAGPVMARFGWGAFTLAEDAEFHLHLVHAGIKVTYAPEASVLAEMPASLRQSRSQNVRWERGRLQVLRAFGPRLLVEGLRRRDPVRLEALIEQLVPPLSVLTALATVSFAITVVCRAQSARRLAALTLLGQACYVISGLRLARARPRAYAALFWAPLYVVWKVGVYIVAATNLRDKRWVRTARSEDRGRQEDPTRRAESAGVREGAPLRSTTAARSRSAATR